MDDGRLTECLPYGSACRDELRQFYSAATTPEHARTGISLRSLRQDEYVLNKMLAMDFFMEMNSSFYLTIQGIYLLLAARTCDDTSGLPLQIIPSALGKLEHKAQQHLGFSDFKSAPEITSWVNPGMSVVMGYLQIPCAQWRSAGQPETR